MRSLLLIFYKHKAYWDRMDHIVHCQVVQEKWPWLRLVEHNQTGLVLHGGEFIGLERKKKINKLQKDLKYLICRCPDHKGRKIGVRKGSLFENSRLDSSTLIMLMWCWAEEISQRRAARWIGVNWCYVNLWYKVR